MFVPYSEVKGGDLLVGYQNFSRVLEDAEPSSAIPGLVHILTEHGHLYMDPEQEVEID